MKMPTSPHFVYKTGERVPESDTYRFVQYVEGNGLKSAPTTEEMEIDLEKGGSFPPIKSTESAAFWRSVLYDD